MIRPSCRMTTQTIHRGLRKYALFWVVALSIILLDQASKFTIGQILPFGTYNAYQGPGGASPIVIVPDYFQIVHIGNPGAAWGIFSGYRFFLIGIAVVALFVIYFCRVQLELGRPIMQFTFGLIVGGVVGNVMDRILFGYVIDFIDVTIPGLSFLGWEPYRWPAFNVADSGITCGVILYLIFSFQSARKEVSANKKSSPDAADS